MKHSTQIGAGVLALAFMGAVGAQAPAPGVTGPAPDASHSLFSSVDMNQDGRVSQAEARTHGDLQTAFGKLDTDGDNYLSQAEFAKWNAAGKAPKPEKPHSTPVE